ncbi:MAG: pyridoxal phosphate-dependent aminotransferase [Fluviicola sp.]
MKLAERMNNIGEYYFSKKMKEIRELTEEGNPIINLGIGNPDLAPPVAAIEKLRMTALFGKANGYQSYKGIDELRQSISDWSQSIYKVSLNPTSEILPLIGSKEGILHITQSFVNAGEEVLVPNPGYPSYQSISSMLGAKVIDYSLGANGEEFVGEIESKINSNTKIIWLNFPHMPTGAMPDRGEIQAVVNLARKHQILVVNDNPYSTILQNDFFSIFQLEGAKEVCLEMNSLSKSHNMAGWRVGWVTGRKELIDNILKAKSNIDSGMYWSIQQGAAEALKQNISWIQNLNQEYSERLSAMRKLLDEIDCRYDEKARGMFVWARVPENYKNGGQLAEELLYETGIFVAPGHVFGSNGQEYIRCSLCAPQEEIEKAIKRIQNLKNGKKAKMVAVTQ